MGTPNFLEEESINKIAKEVGFDTLEPRLKEYFPNLLLPLREYPAQVLGAIEMSLSELSFSYLKYFRKTCENIKNGVRFSIVM